MIEGKPGSRLGRELCENAEAGSRRLILPELRIGIIESIAPALVPGWCRNAQDGRHAVDAQRIGGTVLVPEVQTASLK